MLLSPSYNHGYSLRRKSFVQCQTRPARYVHQHPLYSRLWTKQILCQIREGMTVVTTIPEKQALDREILLSIFSSIGRCRFLEEKHFDACTALSGSGPAFACIVLEAMADGGVMMGLPRAEALELAAQSTCVLTPPRIESLKNVFYSLPRHGEDDASVGCTSCSDQRYRDEYVSSACMLAYRSRTNTFRLAPGGCTIAGLLTLEDGRIRSTIARAIQVATEKARAIGQPSEREK